VRLRRLAPEDLPRLREFWEEHWGGGEMIVHGEVFRPEHLEGLVIDDWVGVVTYSLRGDACEIISLNSFREQRGIGTALIDAVVKEARQHACRRVFLSTTNDNLAALGFYQKRGFGIVRIRRGAIDESRKRKPGIPLMGANGIPLRDEIELEMRLET
jgi:ribosomal protein S18 acetylase RimI-like enzyme